MVVRDERGCARRDGYWTSCCHCDWNCGRIWASEKPAAGGACVGFLHGPLLLHAACRMLAGGDALLPCCVLQAVEVEPARIAGGSPQREAESHRAAEVAGSNSSSNSPVGSERRRGGTRDPRCEGRLKGRGALSVSTRRANRAHRVDVIWPWWQIEMDWG